MSGLNFKHKEFEEFFLKIYAYPYNCVDDTSLDDYCRECEVIRHLQRFIIPEYIKPTADDYER